MNLSLLTRPVLKTPMILCSGGQKVRLPVKLKYRSFL